MTRKERREEDFCDKEQDYMSIVVTFEWHCDGEWIEDKLYMKAPCEYEEDRGDYWTPPFTDIKYDEGEVMAWIKDKLKDEGLDLSQVRNISWDME